MTAQDRILGGQIVVRKPVNDIKFGHLAEGPAREFASNEPAHAQSGANIAGATDTGTDSMKEKKLMASADDMMKSAQTGMGMGGGGLVGAALGAPLGPVGTVAGGLLGGAAGGKMFGSDVSEQNDILKLWLSKRQKSPAPEDPTSDSQLLMSGSCNR